MLLPLRSDQQRFEEIHLITQTSVLPPSLPKAAAAASTPLALLLATANKPAAPPLPLLPLAPSKPTGLRIKRKPQISKFRPKDRKRFRPRARVTESSVNNEVHDDEDDDNDEEEKVDSTTKLETREAASKVNKKSKAAHTSRFSAFGRRPKPGVVAADRRREDVPTKIEEEKLDERETTLPHRQPTTLQASFI